MTPWIVGGVGIVVGILGLAFAVTFYLHLRRWGRLMNYGRIAVAYKGKVKLQAPLREWALWCRMLDADKDSSGRTIYKLGATSIAITKAVMPHGRFRLWLQGIKSIAITKAVTSKSGTGMAQGTWEATDETVKNGG